MMANKTSSVTTPHPKQKSPAGIDPNTRANQAANSDTIAITFEVPTMYSLGAAARLLLNAFLRVYRQDRYLRSHKHINPHIAHQHISTNDLLGKLGKLGNGAEEGEERRLEGTLQPRQARLARMGGGGGEWVLLRAVMQ